MDHFSAKKQSLVGYYNVVQISSLSKSIAWGEEDTLDKSISRFWEVEELPKSLVQSEADKFCEQ